MGDKINSEKIVSETAKRSGLKKADIADFTEGFYSLIEEALFRDGIVKISGLGTFRLDEVSPRISVDVTTGKRMRISGHHKVTFVPELSLAEIVNKPLAHLETVELDVNEYVGFEKEKNIMKSDDNMEEPLKKLAEEAMELRGLLDEINGSAEENVVFCEETEDIEEENPDMVEPVCETENKTEYDQGEPVSAKDIVNAINREDDKDVKGSSVMWILIAVILAISIAVILIFRNRGIFNDDQLVDKTEDIGVVTSAEDIEAEPEFLGENGAVGSEIQEDISDVYSDDFSDIFNRPRHYTVFQDTVTLTEGSRLTWVSLKQYGHKDFWVYIYEANRDIINNPNDIKVGTRLRIPVLDAALIDVNSDESMRYARYLHDLYVK